MTNTAHLLQQAFLCLNAGQREQAAHHCREALSAEPRHAVAFQLLGNIAILDREFELAIEHLENAVRYSPLSAQFHGELGIAYRLAGRYPEAVACCREAVRLDPWNATTHVELGNALRSARDLPEAEACFRTALRIDPAAAVAYNNLGEVLCAGERPAEAIDALLTAVRLAPQVPEAQYNLGGCYQALNRHVQALAAFQTALNLDPNHARAHHAIATTLAALGQGGAALEHHLRAMQLDPFNLDLQRAAGIALQVAGQVDAAESCYRQVLAALPSDAAALNNMLILLTTQKRLAEAQEYLERCTAAAPDNALAFNQLAELLVRQGKLEQALPAYEAALRLEPDNADTHYFYSTTLLALQDFARGWPEFAWRSKMTTVTPDEYRHTGPTWDGAPLVGKTIRVYAEGGLGDTLHFVRYIPQIQDRGGRVLLEVPRTMIPLLTQSGFSNLVAKGTLPVDPTQTLIGLMGLPGMFGIERGKMQAPYLGVDAARVRQWREVLQAIPGFKVGINWQSTRMADFEGRAIPLAMFAQFASLPGVTLINLQHDGAADLAALPDRFPLVDLGKLDQDGAFLDTAAVIKNIDLLITSDTAVAHLAGALGMPVWVAIPFSCDWRWWRGRDDTPWYPTMRLFRQSRLDDWDSVFQEIATELAAVVLR